MPGSPKKRARREAEEREKNLAAGKVAVSTPSPGPEPLSPAPTLLAPAVTPLQGEVLSPDAGAPEPTRTALKRAMRARASEYAEEAIDVLVANMRDKNLAADKRESAANKILEWGFGKPTADLDLKAGDQMVIIRKFVGDEE